MPDNGEKAPLPPLDEPLAEESVGTTEAPSKAAEAPSTPQQPAKADSPEPAAAQAGGVSNDPAPGAPGQEFPQNRPNVGRRVIAYALDWAIAMVLFAILAQGASGLGALVGAAYLLLRDGFDFKYMRGRSLGKQMMGLKVERLDGAEMDLMTSALRNWPLALPLLSLFGLLWLLLAPIALAIVLVEAGFGLLSPEGRRVGDLLARTRVVEAPSEAEL